MASHQSDLDRVRAELEHVKLENARLTQIHADNYQADESITPERFITTRRQGIPRALDETHGKS